jgi:glycosyltransferase involved in cell wall biosynthesis
MRKPILWYGLQPYPSHYRVGSQYAALLRAQYHFADRIEDADIVVLHIEPHDYRRYYADFPGLRNKYVISYAVWEASILPEQYRLSLELVQEIWTCSEYCKNIFASANHNTYVVPHVISRKIDFDDSDRSIIDHLIRYQEELSYFLAIGSTRILRKNLDGLIKGFELTKDSAPNARLIIKEYPGDPMLPTHDQRILQLPLNLTDAQINALYSRTTSYISAHHSEGWGLTLSDAFLFQRPVIATGYSGVLEFINSTNSFLVPYSEEAIRSDDIYGLFTENMLWAYPDLQQLAAYIVEAASNSSIVNEKCARASEACSRFTESSVGRTLTGRIEQISG